MSLLRLGTAAALSGALASCKPHEPPVCFPESGAPPGHSAAETAALADARGRETRCNAPGQQCGLTVRTHADDIWVRARISSPDADGRCAFVVDSDHVCVYTLEGAFKEQPRLP